MGCQMLRSRCVPIRRRHAGAVLAITKDIAVREIDGGGTHERIPALRAFGEKKEINLVLTYDLLQESPRFAGTSRPGIAIPGQNPLMPS